MKMRKIKLTKLFTIKILLLGFFLFLLVSCEIENDEIISETSYKYKIEKVTFSLYKNNISLLKKIDEFNSTKKPIDKFQNKTVNSEDKYKINTKEAIYIENTEGTHHTYSFEISNKNPLELKNIVLSVQADGNYKAYLTTYQISKQERIDIYNGVSVDLSQRTSMKEIDINQLEYANKAGGGCYDLVEVGEEWCDHPGHRLGDLIQGYCNHPKTVYGWVEEPCPGIGGGGVSFSIPSSDVTLYNSGGNSSSNGGTITTSPVALECDNCSNSLSLISHLNLSDQNQINWVNYSLNSFEVDAIFNFGNVNNWSNETLTFAKSAVEALMNGAEVDFDKEIIISSSVPSCVKTIINKLTQDDANIDLGDMPDFVKEELNLSGQIMDVFNNSSKYHLNFKVGNLQPNSLGQEKNAETKFNRSTKAFDITLNSSYVSNATDLSIARTIIHESLHAYISLIYHTQVFSDLRKSLDKLLSQNGDDQNKAEHKLMVKNFINSIANSLESWDNSSLTDNNYYTYLSWSGGMVSTPAFNALSIDFQQNIIDANENEGQAGSGNSANSKALGNKSCN